MANGLTVTTPRCTEKDCPSVDTLHLLGDNECGFMNNNGTPLQKNANDRYHSCRRPNCARQHLSAERRLAHEKDATKHPRYAMTFICDWAGHADAIQDHGFCPVCQ